MTDKPKKIPLSLARARKLLEKAVATQGRDFVYNPDGAGTCYYVPKTDADAPDNAPQKRTGCLIGTMFTLAGVSDNVLEQYEFLGVAQILKNLQDMGIITKAKESDKLDMYLTRAQLRQDDGDTWGEAFDYAEEYIS